MQYERLCSYNLIQLITCWFKIQKVSFATGEHAGEDTDDRFVIRRFILAISLTGSINHTCVRICNLCIVLCMYLLNLLRIGLRERGSARRRGERERRPVNWGHLPPQEQEELIGRASLVFVLVTLNYYQERGGERERERERERGSYDVTRVVFLLSSPRHMVDISTEPVHCHLLLGWLSIRLPHSGAICHLTRLSLLLSCVKRDTLTFSHSPRDSFFFSSSRHPGESNRSSSHFKCRVSNWQCSTKSLIDPLVTHKHTFSGNRRATAEVKKIYRKYELFTLP